MNMEVQADPDAGSPPATIPAWSYMLGAVLAGVLVASGQGRFIPTPTTTACGYGLGVIGAAAGAMFTNFLIQKKAQPQPASTAKVMLTVVAGLFLFFYVAASISILAIPDFYTRAYGTPATRQEMALAWSPSSRHTCAGVVIAEVPFWLENLCLSKRVAPGTVLTLHGQVSPLGFHVARIDTGE